nr:hypothetical protein [Coxiella burnetii]
MIKNCLMKRDVIKSVGFQQVARMSEAKYGKTTMSSIVPVFRCASYVYGPTLVVNNQF